MIRLKERKRKYKIKTLCILLTLTLLTLFFYAQELIVSPTRKPLENYHQDILNNPAQYNLQIQKYFTQKEHIPYLFVQFNQLSTLSQKAQKVRRDILEISPSYHFVEHNATIIMLHGKNGRKEDLLPMAQRYSALGFNCILIDIPAHGHSPLKRLYYGTKEHEKIYIDRVLDDVHLHHSIDTNKLFLWGYSLGGAFAIRTAYQSQFDFKGMVLVSTFDTLDGILLDKSKRLFGNSLGLGIHALVQWSLKNIYHLDSLNAASIDLAGSIKIPLFLLMAIMMN